MYLVSLTWRARHLASFPALNLFFPTNLHACIDTHVWDSRISERAVNVAIADRSVYLCCPFQRISVDIYTTVLFFYCIVPQECMSLYVHVRWLAHHWFLVVSKIVIQWLLTITMPPFNVRYSLLICSTLLVTSRSAAPIFNFCPWLNRWHRRWRQPPMVLWSAVFYCCYDNINDFVAIVAALSLWLVSAASAWTVTTTSADPADDEILKTHRFSSDNFDVYFRSPSRWTARATHANGAPVQ